LPSWLAFNAATQTFSGAAPAGASPLSLSVTATDAFGLSASETFSITPQAPAAPILAAQTADQTWGLAKDASFQLPAGTFTDPQGEALTYSATLAGGAALPSWLTFNAATQTFSGTVPTSASGLSIQVTATNAGGASSSETFSVATPASSPALAAPTANQTWIEGEPASFALPANTFTDPQGSALTYSAALSDGSALPSWLTFNAATQTFSGAAPAGASPLSLSVTATDAFGLSASETFSITPQAPAAPILAAQTASQAWDIGQTVSFQLPAGTFTDPQGEALSYSARLSNGSALPSWLAFNAATQTFSGIAPAIASGLSIQVTATNTGGASSSETFSLTQPASTLMSQHIQLLRNADPGVVIPGIDTHVGSPLAPSQLTPWSALASNPGLLYDPANNRILVKQDGLVLNGINFGSATVDIQANNVTVENCLFAGTTSYYAVSVYGGYRNTTVTNCTFDGEQQYLPLAAWITTGGSATVINNQFFYTPSDGLHCDGGGTISGNFFYGAGFTSNGLHPDGIWVTGSTAPLTISDNLIDWTPTANSNYGTNDGIRITVEVASVSNVTVTGNYLLDGGTSIDAGNEGTAGTFSNISITNNYMGFASSFAWFNGPMTGVTQSGNVVFDYTNPAYAANAWTAYQAAGVPTQYTVVSTNGSNISPTSNGPTTLYGSSTAHLYGGRYENNLVAGYGREFINGGSGANIFTYLTPNGDTAAVNPSWIGVFDPAKDVIDLSNIDADVITPGLQNFTFIGTNPFDGAGAEVRYQQNAAANTTMVYATLAGDTTPDLVIQMTGLWNLTTANFALTPQQSAADLAGGAALGMTTVRSGDAYEYNYTNVQGRSYSSYSGIQYNNGVAADALNLSPTSSELDLFESNATITRGGSAEYYTIAAARPTLPGGSFNLAYHANETIQVEGNAGAETFNLSSGFGAETINGFSASGTNADTLVLQTSAFSYLNSGMTQAQDLAAILANAVNGPSSTTLTDSSGDTLTLSGMNTSTLAANPSAVTFV
jgi:hypothetical protein